MLQCERYPFFAEQSSERSLDQISISISDSAVTLLKGGATPEMLNGSKASSTETLNGSKAASTKFSVSMTGAVVAVTLLLGESVSVGDKVAVLLIVGAIVEGEASVGDTVSVGAPVGESVGSKVAGGPVDGAIVAVWGVVGAVVTGVKLGCSGDTKIGSPQIKSPDSLCCVKNERGRPFLESTKACSKLQLDVDESNAALKVSLWI